MKNNLNSEQIAPSAKSWIVFKMMDVTMTKMQYMKPFQCLEKHEMFMTKIYPSYLCSVAMGLRYPPRLNDPWFEWKRK